VLARSKCGRCAAAWYCGKACQRAHWPAHKKPCAAHAEADRDFEQGRAHAEAHEARAAVECFERAAALGHADAAFHYGDALMFGAGVAMDKPRAVELWRAAAQAGHARAMQALLWGRGKCDCQGAGACTCPPRAQ
jgi:TPR repeat protein